MATSLTSSLSSTFSTLSLRRHSLPLHPHPTSFSLPKPLSFPSLKTHAADIDTTFFDTVDPDEITTFDPPEKPEGFVAPPSFDEGPQETEEQIARAYEELYGPAYSGESVLGNDVYVMDSKVKKTSSFGKVKKDKIRDGFEERVVQVTF